MYTAICCSQCADVPTAMPYDASSTALTVRDDTGVQALEIALCTPLRKDGAIGNTFGSDVSKRHCL